ncbi:MAG: SOS response-associated peptidase [Deltaproteobacteria bacterium]
MCGRFAVTATPSMIASHFELAESFELPPNYNITPSQQIPVVRIIEGERRLSFMRWGLIPHWAKDEKIGYRMINARSETVFEKPAFRNAAKSRRCLIPASGFFEWQKAGGQKQPYYVKLRGRDLFAFAGLWESWQKSENERVESCSILTTGANELMLRIHDRMPVILAPTDYDLWMRPDFDVKSLSDLLRPPPSQEMSAYPVSQAVNNPRHNQPDCIVPLRLT